MRKKIAIIIGVRPHFVKLATLYPFINDEFEVIIIHTGQHFDFEMSKVFFQELEICAPDYQLGIGSGIHTEQVGTGIIEIGRILRDHRPSCVIVFGDANSSLAGAVAAAKLGIPVAHIEAGARNFDLQMPEEINRLIIDSISSLYFCPTDVALESLKRRGLDKNIFVTGDLLLDSVIKNINSARSHSDILQRLGVSSKQYYLLTIHRAENTGGPENIREIIDALYEIDEKIVFPIHPRTKNFLQEIGLIEEIQAKKNFIIVPPVSYFDILVLLENSKVVLSDSNGIQREAFFLNTPCVILRDRTEYMETVEAGGAILTSVEKKGIVQSVKLENFKATLSDRSVFGNGQAAQKITSILRQVL